jgi:hypothetical protein
MSAGGVLLHLFLPHAIVDFLGADHFSKRLMLVVRAQMALVEG